jgi:hypothetical protein
MSSLIPERLALLERAAELRARGTPWDDIAAKLTVAPDDIRRLSSENARAYARLARRAKREFRSEAMNATIAKLRDLLNHEQVGIAMAAAATLVRYDLARMRHEQHAGRPPKNQRQRDELPPLPSGRVASVTVDNTRCDSRCDTTPVTPQVQAPKPVPAELVGAQKTGCDTVTAVTITTPVTPTPPTAPVPAKPVASREKTRVVDAIRRKRWLPPGLAPSR